MKFEVIKEDDSAEFCGDYVQYWIYHTLKIDLTEEEREAAKRIKSMDEYGVEFFEGQEGDVEDFTDSLAELIEEHVKWYEDDSGIEEYIFRYEPVEGEEVGDHILVKLTMEGSKPC